MDFSDIDALKERRAEIYDRAKRLSESAAREKRDFTSAEQADWDRFNRELDDLSDRIETKRDARLAAITGGNNTVDSERTTRPGEARFLEPRQKIASGKDYNLPSGLQARDLSMGRYIAGIVSGSWKGREAEEELRHQTRTQGGASATLGGFLVPDVLSDQVIDLARNKSVVVAAGARTYQMENERVRLARVTGDATASWRVENTTITASTVTFGSIDLRARSLASMIPVSRELIQDASNAADVIENSMSAVMALGWDLAALRGNGAAEQPTGIRFTSNVSLSTSTGASTGYGALSRLVRDVYVNNYLGSPESLSMIFAPRTFYTYGNLIDGQGQPLRQPPTVDPVRKYQTNQIPTASTLYGGDSESEVYVGPFDQLLLAVRSPLEIKISDDVGFTANQTYVRTIWRGDCAILQPTWFSVLVGTTA